MAKRGTSAERVRRHRQRRRDGEIVLTVAVAEVDLVLALQDAGLLRSVDADNPQQISRALERAIGKMIVPI
jgi:hypothetical protein